MMIRCGNCGTELVDMATDQDHGSVYITCPCCKGQAELYLCVLYAALGGSAAPGEESEFELDEQGRLVIAPEASEPGEGE